MCKSTRQRNQTGCVKRFDILDHDGDTRAEEGEERRTDDWNETKASVIASKFFSPTSNQIVSGIAPNVCVIQHQQHLLCILYCAIQHHIKLLFLCVIQHQQYLLCISQYDIVLCNSASASPCTFLYSIVLFSINIVFCCISDILCEVHDETFLPLRKNSVGISQ